MLRFSDGVQINPSGPLRKLRLADGWYVVGDDMILPCADEAEADALLSDLTTEAQAPAPAGGEEGSDA